jgi:hypothetical protein
MTRKSNLTLECYQLAKIDNCKLPVQSIELSTGRNGRASTRKIVG